MGVNLNKNKVNKRGSISVDVTNNQQEDKTPANVIERELPRYSLIDINRILVHYFSRDERVALALNILKYDLKLNINGKK